jgi:hypothetical protein
MTDIRAQNFLLQIFHCHVKKLRTPETQLCTYLQHSTSHVLYLIILREFVLRLYDESFHMNSEILTKIFK